MGFIKTLPIGTEYPPLQEESRPAFVYPACGIRNDARVSKVSLKAICTLCSITMSPTPPSVSSSKTILFWKTIHCCKKLYPGYLPIGISFGSNVSITKYDPPLTTLRCLCNLPLSFGPILCDRATKAAIIVAEPLPCYGARAVYPSCLTCGANHPLEIRIAPWRGRPVYGRYSAFNLFGAFKCSLGLYDFFYDTAHQPLVPPSFRFAVTASIHTGKLGNINLLCWKKLISPN